MNIPITKPYFDGTEAESVKNIINGGWIAQGNETKKFEDQLTAYTGAHHAVVVSSGTTALHLALTAHDIGPRDEVIIPSFSFIATANAVVHTGARPVFVDINPSTYNIDPQHIENAITPETKAIMPVHQVGVPSDMDMISAIARNHKLLIIEDAACALGSQYKEKPIGNSENLCCFSFHPRKIITTGEGGAVLTNDEKMYKTLALLRNHGMSVQPQERHTLGTILFEDYLKRGYNYKITDIQSAIGILQMDKLDEIIRNRRKLAQRYDAALKGSKIFIIPQVPHNCESNYQTYLVRIKDESELSRNEILLCLNNKGIGAKQGIQSIHKEKAYYEEYRDIKLPETEKATAQTVALPLFPGLTFEEQDFIIDVLQSL